MKLSTKMAIKWLCIFQAVFLFVSGMTFVLTIMKVCIINYYYNYTGEENCPTNCTGLPVITATIDCNEISNAQISVLYSCIVHVAPQLQALIWSGSFIASEVAVTPNTKNVSFDPTIIGLYVSESHVHSVNCSCFQSTLTFTGNLTALHNETLSCRTNDIADIAVLIPPRKL